MFQPYAVDWCTWFKKAFALSVGTKSADNIDSYSSSAARQQSAQHIIGLNKYCSEESQVT